MNGLEGSQVWMNVMVAFHATRGAVGFGADAVLNIGLTAPIAPLNFLASYEITG
jgi:hypothetical protein